MDKIDIDIELALTDLSSINAAAVLQILPHPYTLEDKSINGWGYVLRAPDDALKGDLNHGINRFLSGVEPISEWITGSSSILRVAIYSSNLTCTIRLDSFSMLDEYSIELAITVYPVC